MEHFIERCSCGVVLMQCRCPGNKKETVSSLPCPHASMSHETVRPKKILSEIELLAELNGVLFGETVEKSNACIRAILDHNDLLHAQAVALARELRNIASADTRDWDDPTDFKAWAQSRARFAVQQAQALLEAQ